MVNIVALPFSSTARLEQKSFLKHRIPFIINMIILFVP